MAPCSMISCAIRRCSAAVTWRMEALGGNSMAARISGGVFALVTFRRFSVEVAMPPYAVVPEGRPGGLPLAPHCCLTASSSVFFHSRRVPSNTGVSLPWDR